jgi:hypothetical protein
MISVRPLGPEHAPAVLSILRSRPMVTPAMSIWFDRSPDPFMLPRLHYPRFRYAGFFHGEELMGLILIGFHEGHVNGRPETLFTLTDFYITREIYRHFDVKVDYPRVFHQGSDLLFSDLPEGCDLGYYAIMEGNRPAEAFVGRRPASAARRPFSRTVARQEVRVILVGPPRRRKGRYPVRRATMEDVDRIVALLQDDFRQRLFGPVITRERFLAGLEQRPDFGIRDYVVAERGGELVGACAGWDTGMFKRSRVTGYSRALTMTRLAFNVGSRFWRSAPLPDVGGAFREIHVTDYAVRDRDPEIMASMLGLLYASARKEGYNLINFASASDDPLLRATDGFWTERVPSHVVLASMNEDRLRDDRVEVRLPYMDVALL